MKKLYRGLYISSVVLAIVARLAITVIPGNSIRTPWSGGGDMLAYETLARNLVSGNGYTYAHVPSAWRTPGFPLVAAAAMELFGTHFAIAVRGLQTLLSILASYFCMRTARIFFGDTAAKLSLLAALYFPTLVYFSGEFLSESLSAFFVALFFWMFAEDLESPRWATLVGMGSSIGLGAMFRPNVAAIGSVGLIGAWLFRHSWRTRLQLAWIPICVALVFAPWIFRNYRVFGKFIMSTKSGADALCGALNPESRFHRGWEDRMRGLVGYLLPNDLETNSASRVALGSELDLDRKCWKVTRRVWSEMSWRQMASWTAGKWVAYWLSTDQLDEPAESSWRSQIVHVCGVIFCWLLLALACLGWWELKNLNPQCAALLLGYAVLMTVLHTPFVMNTRIRSPMIDPLIAILAGGSWLVFRARPDSRPNLSC